MRIGCWWWSRRVAALVLAVAPSFIASPVQGQPLHDAPKHSARGCGRHAAVPWQAVAPGVWAWLPPAPEPASPRNGGHTQAISVLVDRGEAMVVDPGPSLQHGQRVRESLACRFGARVRWVVNTHAHAENVLGNAAFADPQAQGRLRIVATAGTLSAMQRRCTSCLASIKATVGAAALRGTRITLPTHVLAPGDVLQVGDLRVEVRVAPDAHTESDLLLWLPARRVLWAGGLVSDARVPELAQGSVGGWLDALEGIARLQPAPEVVIGTGVSHATGGQPAPAVAATRSYLAQLRLQLRAALDAGLHGTEPEVAAAMDPGRWVGFKAQHAFNVQRAWREVEAQWMSESGAAAPQPGGAAPAAR